MDETITFLYATEQPFYYLTLVRAQIDQAGFERDREGGGGPPGLTGQDQPVMVQLRDRHGASTNLRNSPEFWQLVERLEHEFGLEENSHDTAKISQR